MARPICTLLMLALTAAQAISRKDDVCDHCDDEISLLQSKLTKNQQAGFEMVGTAEEAKDGKNTQASESKKGGPKPDPELDSTLSQFGPYRVIPSDCVPPTKAVRSETADVNVDEREMQQLNIPRAALTFEYVYPEESELDMPWPAEEALWKLGGYVYFNDEGQLIQANAIEIDGEGVAQALHEAEATLNFRKMDECPDKKCVMVPVPNPPALKKVAKEFCWMGPRTFGNGLFKYNLHNGDEECFEIDESFDVCADEECFVGGQFKLETIRMVQVNVDSLTLASTFARTSERGEVNLPVELRPRLLIPPDATSFAFVYPDDAVLARRMFRNMGGFAFYKPPDANEKNPQGRELLQANTFSPDPEGQMRFKLGTDCRRQCVPQEVHWLELEHKASTMCWDPHQGSHGAFFFDTKDGVVCFEWVPKE